MKGAREQRAVSIALVASGAIVFRTTFSFLGQLGGHRLIIASSVFVIFGIFFLLFSFGSWNVKKWGIFGGIITTITFYIVRYSDIKSIIANPYDPDFIYTISFVIASVATIYFGTSVYLKKTHRRAESQVPHIAPTLLLKVLI